jgi:hypothetical protein
MPCDMFPIGSEEKHNPAIQLFGNRLYIDQSPTELLVELLLVADSPKWIGKDGEEVAGALPTDGQLGRWPHGAALVYAPRARLNLKLLAFMGASRLDSRHETHRQHFKELLERIKQNLRVADGGDKEDVLRTLESLFLGFHGAGGGRTWCAQSFAPVSRGLLAGETIWNETEAHRAPPSTWMDVVAGPSKYLTMNRHRFLARGGEVLYIEICRALREPAENVRQWAQASGVGLAKDELDPVCLCRALGVALDEAMDHCPQTVAHLADFLDRGIEPETAQATDGDDTERRKVQAGCCADESWQEGYLFAVDLLRLCKADLDPMERLSLLESACALQVLRTLAAQSARHCADERKATWPGYRLAFAAPQEDRAAVKRISRDSARMAERMIHHAIRTDDAALPSEPDERARKLREADRRYGGKLFTGLCKRIGLLVPRKGAGARFTLDERLLRLLVVTTVPAGGRLQYDTFKQLVEARHGFVFDAEGLNRAAAWANGADPVNLGGAVDAWLHEMLAAAGLLVELSDSCSLVKNPAQRKGGAA